MLNLMCNIELNPVSAGMVAHQEDCRWSSYRCQALGESGLNFDWLTAREEYLRLGCNKSDSQTACSQLFKAAISGNDLKEIRECSHEGWVLGGKHFRKQIEALGQRRTASKGVARPRKE